MGLLWRHSSPPPQPHLSTSTSCATCSSYWPASTPASPSARQGSVTLHIYSASSPSSLPFPSSKHRPHQRRVSMLQTERVPPSCDLSHLRLCLGEDRKGYHAYEKFGEIFTRKARRRCPRPHGRPAPVLCLPVRAWRDLASAIGIRKAGPRRLFLSLGGWDWCSGVPFGRAVAKIV